MTHAMKYYLFFSSVALPAGHLCCDILSADWPSVFGIMSLASM